MENTTKTNQISCIQWLSKITTATVFGHLMEVRKLEPFSRDVNICLIVNVFL